MKPKYIFAGVVVIAVAIFLFIMLSSVNKPSTFEVKDGDFIIGGAFGVTVPVSGISGLNLTDTPPNIVTKTNGSGLGTVYKGEFTLDGNRKARLYIDASKPPFITFSYDGTVIYVNLKEAQETRALYQKLSEAHK